MNRNQIFRLLGFTPALAALLWATSAFAVDNTATGDIKGVTGDLTDSNLFTINTSTLALVKAAFLTDGTQLTSGATVPSGTRVRFMIYVDNTTAVPVTDINASDALAVGFTYVGSSIKVDNSVATGGTEAAIYAAVNATSAVSDANDTDDAGISGTTITAGSTGGNAQVDIAASAVWAMLFEVTVN